MNKEVIIFVDIDVNKRKYYCYKNKVLIDNIKSSLQGFFWLKEIISKCFPNKNNVRRFINDDLEIYSDDSDEEASDKSDRHILMNLINRLNSNIMIVSFLEKQTSTTLYKVKHLSLY